MKPAPAPAGPDEPLGAVLRRARKEKAWTLDDVAKRAGVGRSTLSKIENGQSRPGFDVLRRLSEALELGPRQLFAPTARIASPGRKDVTKKNAGEKTSTPTYDHEMLAADLTTKAMLPYKSRIKARSAEDFGDWVRHEGEEFLYVLDGAVELRFEHYKPMTLERGDSAYYDAAMGHMALSVSEEDAVVLWVTLPR